MSKKTSLYAIDPDREYMVVSYQEGCFLEIEVSRSTYEEAIEYAQNEAIESAKDDPYLQEGAIQFVVMGVSAIVRSSPLEVTVEIDEYED